MRGSSALFAAADTVVRIDVLKPEGADPDTRSLWPRKVVIEKLKSGREGEWFHFGLVAKSLGVDTDGDHVTACLVQEIAPPVKAVKQEKPERPVVKLTAGETAALADLTRLFKAGGSTAGLKDHGTGIRTVTVDDWRDEVTGGKPRIKARGPWQAFERAKDRLLDAGIIRLAGPDGAWGIMPAIEDGAPETALLKWALGQALAKVKTPSAGSVPDAK
jgi:hypothetical protein